ncbi:hypothetical protein LIER_19482 [Lithospermum erythrorhizon]|uniref:DUF7026 domain-containing protein n=1 Tax=Lithospermum erythrorhizon TaxID=34254 RepID=A0AAV3QNI2_LITER
MALQSTTLFLNKLPTNTSNLKKHPIFSNTLFKSPPNIKYLCAKNRSDADLALEFAIEAAKLNTNEVQRKEAIKKSKSLLFAELCKYMSLEQDDFKNKWSKMCDDDKFVLVKEFVANWGAHFHPLSAKSVKELVDEYLVLEIPPSDDSSAPKAFSIFKRLMGFLED